MTPWIGEKRRTGSSVAVVGPRQGTTTIPTARHRRATSLTATGGPQLLREAAAYERRAQRQNAGLRTIMTGRGGHCVQTRSPTPKRRAQDNPGGDLLSHTVTRAVPSAVEGLTSVFGMGTGVTPLLSPPESWRPSTRSVTSVKERTQPTHTVALRDNPPSPKLQRTHRRHAAKAVRILYKRQSPLPRTTSVKRE